MHGRTLVSPNVTYFIYNASQVVSKSLLWIFPVLLCSQIHSKMDPSRTLPLPDVVEWHFFAHVFVAQFFLRFCFDVDRLILSGHRDTFFEFVRVVLGVSHFGGWRVFFSTLLVSLGAIGELLTDQVVHKYRPKHFQK